MSSFTAQLEAFAKKTNQRIDTVVNKTCFELSNSIVKKTPVDTGMARNNWMPSINTITDGGNIPSMANKAYGNIYYFTNNLPYIRRLEYGWSKQAPNGMVRLTLQEFKRVIKKAINESK